MKVKEVMSVNPTCCTTTDTVQQVAKMMCDLNVGSIPVIADRQSRALMGMSTDRDLCCRVLALGLNATSTPIQEFVSYNPAICRDGENVESCERLSRVREARPGRPGSHRWAC